MSKLSNASSTTNTTKHQTLMSIQALIQFEHRRKNDKSTDIARFIRFSSGFNASSTSKDVLRRGRCICAGSRLGRGVNGTRLVHELVHDIIRDFRPCLMTERTVIRTRDTLLLLPAKLNPPLGSL